MDFEMNSEKHCKRTDTAHRTESRQNILVFQQNGSGESKIRGVKEYGKGRFNIEVFSIDIPLPPIIDDPAAYLPEDFSADLVLDFLKHPDLSHDLARLCHANNIPIVASGKKHQEKWAITPPT